MKKILLIMLAVLLIIISIFITVKYIEKRTVERHFDTFLKDHGYQDDILTRETNYDSKIGKFYTRVSYKKYPERTYEYYYFSEQRFFGAAYERGVAVETTEYLENAAYP